MNETANRIKELRLRRGYSQEELAERSSLALRTIQRIENGETVPRGDSLTRLAAALDVTVDDLADWGVVDDRGFIVGMNLSALSFLVFPLLGIIVPLIIYMFKRGKIRGLFDAARGLLNFQITWVIFLFVGAVAMFSFRFSPQFVLIMYFLNFMMITCNSFRINRGKKVVYRPAIPFIR